MSDVSPEETPVPDLHVGPAPTTPAPDPNPAAVAKTNELLSGVRFTANFNYELVTDVVKELLEAADVPAGTIAGDGRLVSMIRFEDEPLRFCLERLRHMVSGTCEVNDQGAVDFKAGS